MLGYGINGTTDIRLNSILDFNIASLPLNFGGQALDRFEAGGMAGTGMEIQAGVGRLSLDLSYQHGFTSVTDIPVVDVGIRNQGFGVGIGYSIPIGRKRTSAKA